MTLCTSYQSRLENYASLLLILDFLKNRHLYFPAEFVMGRSRKPIVFWLTELAAETVLEDEKQFCKMRNSL